jgi:hypothetical protein
MARMTDEERAHKMEGVRSGLEMLGKEDTLKVLHQINDGLDMHTTLAGSSPCTFGGDAPVLIAAALKILIMLIQLAEDKENEIGVDSD